MKVALLTTDNRWVHQDFDNPIPHFGTAPQALIEGMMSVPELEVHIVSSSRRPVAAPAKLAENIWFHSNYVPKLGWMRTAYQGCILATFASLKAIAPDIVHGQGTESDCAISAVLCGFPNILTIHGNMRRIARVEQSKPFSYFWIAARFESFAIRRTLGVVCLTHHTQNEVRAGARKTWIVPNAVDSSFFAVDSQPLSDVPRILCAGRVCPLKNQNAFIRALDPLAKQYRFALVFAGKASLPDPYAKEFLQLVSARPWCTHVDFVRREKLREILSQTSILALTSLEENCPMVVLEAMAAGVPVLAARVGGVPDLIEEGKTGTFCDPTDLDSMRAGIQQALANLDALNRMGRCAKESALRRFHPKQIALQHLAIYREALHQS